VNPPPGRRRERLGLVFAGLCALNGAFVPGVARLTTSRADALFVAAASSAAAGVCALVLLAWRGELGRLVERRRVLPLLAIGALGTAFAYLLFYEGARRTSAIVTVLCAQVECVYALIAARVFLGHPVTGRRMLAVAGILSGIALALEVKGVSGWIGVLLLLAAPLGWQISHLIVLRGLGEVQPPILTAARYLYGGALLVLIWAAQGGAARLPAAADLLALAPILVVQGTILNFGGTFLWYQTISRLDLARSTAIVVPSIPVLSLGASFLLLGEVATGRQWLGLLLAAAGVLLFVTAKHPPSPRERVPVPGAPIAVEPGV
jgi:drug/metabolite transporter (DMT)-like permease